MIDPDAPDRKNNLFGWTLISCRERFLTAR
jgi:hypothetical protein